MLYIGVRKLEEPTATTNIESDIVVYMRMYKPAYKSLQEGTVWNSGKHFLINNANIEVLQHSVID